MELPIEHMKMKSELTEMKKSFDGHLVPHCCTTIVHEAYIVVIHICVSSTTPDGTYM